MKRLLPIILLFAVMSAKAQFNMDTTISVPSVPEMYHQMQERSAKVEGLLNILREFRIQAYIQPEWQRGDSAGIQSFAGGNFPTSANNRFLLRRGRFKLSWQHDAVTKRGDTVKVGEFAFQFDASEKGFTAVKDFYGKLIDPWTGWFGIQGGIFLRPFGYETPAPPMTHESPEFSRMNQTIFPNECELGEAIVIESPRRFKPVYLRLDASLVNGEGIGVGSQTGTYQSRKDFIGRIMVGKSFQVNEKLKLSLNASGSYYNGGVLQTTNNVYEVENVGGTPEFVNVTKGTSDTANKFHNTYKREYYGAHLQFNIDAKVNENFGTTTSIRGEFIGGTQPGQLTSSQVPLGATNAAPGLDLYMRKFEGVVVNFTQGFHFKRPKDKAMIHSDITVKFDSYDPNTAVHGTELSKANGFSTTDLKYNTLGFGYTICPTAYFKLVVWYDHVMMPASGLVLPTTITHQDVLTIRTQFMIDTWWFNKRSTTNSNLITRSY